MLHTCCDRLALREYAAARVGAEHLVPLLGVYDAPEQIPWADLAPPYVVKPTHGCDWNIFVKRPSDVVPERFESLLQGRLRTDYYRTWGEWCYKGNPRQIVVERYLLGPEGEQPEDYKFYCFHGEPVLAIVCRGRRTADICWTVYDAEWNRLSLMDSVYRPGPDIPRPARLEELLSVARGLSRDFDHVRVDLYCTDDGVYVGEVTMYPAAGRVPLPDEAERWLGAFWRLPSPGEVRPSRRHRRL